MNNIMSLLFETNAFRVCEENKPFWYTSGKIGPYFVNTHFLYGSEEEANKLLDFINKELEEKDIKDIPKDIFDEVLKQYNQNQMFKEVVNALVEYVKKEIDVEEIDYISGGERRDWLFSNLVAHLLNKPHISLFKNMSSVVSDSKFESNTITSGLEGKSILHVADLVNQASSYTRYIEIIGKLGGTIKWSLAVVDRMQGGTEKLEELGIEPLSLFKIDKSLFEKAEELNIISSEQRQMLNDYVDDPDGSMVCFLKEHPEFLENALKADPKSAQRAQKCIDEKIYDL